MPRKSRTGTVVEVDGRHVWCQRHPTYKGIRAPRGTCAACLFVWQTLDHERLAERVRDLETVFANLFRPHL